MTPKPKKTLPLSKNDFIVTAWAELAGGPGWSNTLVKVLDQDRSGKLRFEYLQTGELSQEIPSMVSPTS